MLQSSGSKDISCQQEEDVLSGEDVIPGFRCPLREILPRRAPADEPGPAVVGPNGPGPA
jgi:hypothetical protein